MLSIKRRCESPVGWDVELVLPFELRQKSRLRTALPDGEAVGLFLERGRPLRDGDLLLADDGRVVRVRAVAEAVLDIECSNARDLTRVAYHLGNRHVPMQIGEGWLRIAMDDVLRKMVEGLGARVVERQAPFEPEAGAYAAHSHGAPPTHRGVIHEFSATSNARRI